MQRRDFSAALAATGMGLGLAGAATTASAQGAPREGADYLVLGQRVPSEAPTGKIEVIEFFWYSCPHCNAFEPKLEAWIKRAPADVSVRRVPVAFRPDFEPQQRLFYTLEALGKFDEVHRKVFYAIHVERQPLNKEDAIVAWAEKQGLDRAKFTEAWKSFGVSTKVRRAVQSQTAYGVQGVPSLGVAGRYYTDATLAQNMDRALAVAEFLIGEARKGRV
ncbi:MAG: thiol:disulfide interchange protein DsbA/DsbL [Burkholderiaceae bacterium]